MPVAHSRKPGLKPKAKTMTEAAIRAENHQIAIVGAGIGGLAAAALLAGAGCRVTVFDRFKAPAPVGSGLVIQPVGQAVLAKIGVLDTAMTLGAPVRRMVGQSGANRRALDVTYDPNGQRFGLGLHRASLFETLLGAARAAGATLVPDHAALSLDKGFLTFPSGREGPFDLVIDAAGAGSPLTPLHGKPLPFGAVWATVPWPEAAPLPTDNLSQRYARADRMAGVLPIGTLPGTTTPFAAIFWSLRVDAYADWAEAPFEAWTEQATKLWPEYAPFVEPLNTHQDLTMARYSHGNLRRPYSEGLIHIGDAAHQASPQLGQGANMALLDAAALTDAILHGPLATAGPRYAAARRRHVAVYQVCSRFLTPLYQSSSIMLPILRDYLFAPAAGIPPAPRVIARLVSGDLVAPIRGF